MASGQQWRGLSKEALPSTAAFLEVYRSAEAYLKRGNSAGCVFQLVRVTMAAAQEPLKFGIGYGGEFGSPGVLGSLQHAYFWTWGGKEDPRALPPPRLNPG